MPVVIRAMPWRIERNDLRRSPVVFVIEQQQLESGRVAREDAEVDAAIADTRTQWSAAAGFDIKKLAHHPRRRYLLSISMSLASQ